MYVAPMRYAGADDREYRHSDSLASDGGDSSSHERSDGETVHPRGRGIHGIGHGHGHGRRNRLVGRVLQCTTGGEGTEGEDDMVEGRTERSAKLHSHMVAPGGDAETESEGETAVEGYRGGGRSSGVGGRARMMQSVRSSTALLSDDGLRVEQPSDGEHENQIPESGDGGKGGSSSSDDEAPVRPSTGAGRPMHGYTAGAPARPSSAPGHDAGAVAESGVKDTPSTTMTATSSHSPWPSGDSDEPESGEEGDMEYYEEDHQLPDWQPPVPCPAPNGGCPKLRMGPMLHFYAMAPICLCTVTMGVVYLGWKTFEVFSHITKAGPTSVIFLTTEWLLFLSSLMLMMEISRPCRDRPALMIPPTGPFPLTNIFICCCKEPVDIIADTVRGAMQQVYPPSRYTVWVLDDGGDEKLRAWVEAEAAEKYGHHRLKYLSRQKKKGVPHHFKAGNINHGLNHASGEFVAILDADMIPSPYFLTSLLPHFSSEKIAFVQCPQSFYNVVRGDPLNDTSRDFYDVLLPYRDGRDSAQCVGTGAIFRMSCLRQNGGFTVGTITEDFDTAMSLHSRGYDSVYVNQKLQAGLAAWTLEAYVKQHQRWATGSLQLLFQRKPALIKDARFSLYRRVSYWWAGVQYYMNLVAIMVLLLPLIIVAFDLPIMPLNSPPSVTKRYLILLVPYMFFARLAGVFLSIRFPHSDSIMIRSEQPWYWMSYWNTTAIFKFFFPLISKQFEATGAKKHVEKTILQRLGVVWFHLSFCILSLGIIAWQLATLNYHECPKLLKIGGWTPAILYTVQTMFVPIWHVLLSPWHPKPDKRREYLCYTEDGVPYFRADQVVAPYDWRMKLFHVLPTLWFSLVIFFFYCAVTDYSPPFCQDGGFFGYGRF